MTNVKIPVTLDPVRAAQKRLSFVGVVNTSNLTRLLDGAEGADEQVTVEIHCGIDEQKLYHISGSANVSVNLPCQRCGEVMTVDLAASFAFSPVRSEDEELPERYEPVVLNEDGEVMLHELIEDELILALPIVPKHEDDGCQYAQEAMSWGDLPEESTQSSPFDVLKELKRK
ncbi:23S rRNA accumulation protein YceD [Algicola sagamiensis]|uniref:23S rRNA accumulation protein YceD n=1 Tax=Algicola sagamiensis TaxID=163869 RepID=UPI00037B2F3A|nr:23S rRNA accumulation protein YceD [Algicola sagamiensis]